MKKLSLSVVFALMVLFVLVLPGFAQDFKTDYTDPVCDDALAAYNFVVGDCNTVGSRHADHGTAFANMQMAVLDLQCQMTQQDYETAVELLAKAYCYISMNDELLGNIGSSITAAEDNLSASAVAYGNDAFEDAYLYASYAIGDLEAAYSAAITVAEYADEVDASFAALETLLNMYP